MNRLLRRPLALLAAAILVHAGVAAAQDTNIIYPVPLIEQRLREQPFELQDRQGSRFEGDRTQRVTLMFPDSTLLMVKWARAARGGERFNNVPRYELAAYELQKLFLDEASYVVPPTVARMVPLHWYRTVDARVVPTFDGANSVLVVLQYWLWEVTPEGFFDLERFAADSLYARHLANMNILTYLIRHNDSNQGNFLISKDARNPRLFSVDNGVAFRSAESSRGFEWRELRVDRLPRATVERLRGITRAELERALGVIAQFEVRDGELVPVPPTENLSGGRGIRRRGEQLQIGLTTREIRDVEGRLRRLVRLVDAGRIQTF
jgi:hypothetical protein